MLSHSFHPLAPRLQPQHSSISRCVRLPFPPCPLIPVSQVPCTLSLPLSPSVYVVNLGRERPREELVVHELLHEGNLGVKHHVGGDEGRGDHEHPRGSPDEARNSPSAPVIATAPSTTPQRRCCCSRVKASTFTYIPAEAAWTILLEKRDKTISI